MQKHNVSMCERLQGTATTCTNTMDNVVKQLKVYTEKVTGLSDAKSGELLRDNMSRDQDNLDSLLRRSQSSRSMKSAASDQLSSISESAPKQPSKAEKLAELRARLKVKKQS
jgi:hypothetical protein